MTCRTLWRFIAILATLYAALPVCSAQSDSAQVTGSVAYRERIALPSDAVVDVQLIDLSVADIASQVIAEAMISAEGRQVPLAFALQYDPAKVVPAHRYSVRATIRSGDGMLMFSTTQAYPVLTHGAPSKVSLLLHTVGHGVKPGGTAKKEPAPPTEKSETSEKPAEVAASASAPPAVASEPAAGPAQQKAPETSKADTQAASEPSASSAPSPPPAIEAPSAKIEKELESEAAPASPDAKAAQASAPELPLPEAPSALTKSEAPSESAEVPHPSSEAKPSGAAAEAESSSRAPATEPPVAATPSAPEPETEAAPTSPTKPLSPLADTQWRVVQMGGTDIVIQPPDKPLTLAFSPDGTRIAGSAGCNSYIGTFTDDNGRLTLNPGSMTMIACAGPAMQRQQKFVSVLRAADGFKLRGTTLSLTSKGKVLAKFENLLTP